MDRDKDFNLNAGGDSSSGSLRSRESLKGNIREMIAGGLLCRPPKQAMGVKTDDHVPFYTPHKRLLEKIEYKKELPEPLTGFKKRQEDLLSKRRKLPPIPSKLSVPILSKRDSDILSTTTNVTFQGTQKYR
ncbi:uncharacterized protein LOC143198424 isoform X2 [Rhynchophorus ferrugineus]|uniref:uncharacterized protein LOC143198424 isoform X2 n=1 Tax=Rhynchophorus ferrugineus TaxID=354439 RepID=UPI003FCE782A